MKSKLIKFIKKAATTTASYAALFFIHALSFQPLSVGYLVSDILTKMIAKKKKVAETAKRNLRRAFPEWTPEKVDAVYREYIRGCIDYMFEFLHFAHLSEKEIRKRCKFKNIALCEQLFKDHKFIICYAGHFLNYEYTVSCPLHLHNYGMCHMYLADRPNIFQDWILKSRSRFGAINIPTSNPLRTIVKLQKDFDEGKSKHPGYILGTLADMDTKEANPHCSDFFNRKMEMMTGSERIAKKYGMAFVFAKITRPRRGYYEIEFKKIVPSSDLSESKYPYTDEFVRMLEENIKEQPEIWLHWASPRF